MPQAPEPRPRWTLDPKLDVVFSLLFGAEANRRLLIALLNDVLSPEAPIVSVELLPPRPEPADVDDKLVFLDLRVRLATGEQVDVEMQAYRHAALRPRVLFYWGRLYTGQLKRGEPYSKLQRCAVILITDFSELEGAGFHSVFQVRERTTGELLSPHLEVHLLELAKLRSVLARADEPDSARWCRFLSAKTDAELEALAKQYPIMKEAKDALDELSNDPVARERAARRESELYFHEYGFIASREEGHALGLAEGRAEGRAEGHVEGRRIAERAILLKLLHSKFGELPAETASRIDSATDQELERWLPQLLSADTLEAVFR